MDEQRIRQDEFFAHLPPEWPQDLLPLIQARLREAGRKLVVLDDDPTGTQTVHGVAVLTQWPVERLAEELLRPEPVVYLLTNSRSLTGSEAEALYETTGRRLREAARDNAGLTSAKVSVVSRSDSTLRGHFPGEVAALARGLGQAFDAWLVVPCFPEGGRFTVDDIHYVADGEWLVPAGQTEFARDKTFGYRASNLREWVAEKTGGAVPVEQVTSISLAGLRQGGPAAVTRKLLHLPRGAVCVVNAASYRDLEVLVLGLLEAEARGKRYLYRTAASFVRVRAGIAPRALLTRADLGLPETGAGLVVAGSYVPRTTTQLKALIEQTKIRAVEVRVQRLLDAAARAGEIEQARQEMNHRLAAGEDVLVFTSRELVESAAQEVPAADNLPKAEDLPEASTQPAGQEVPGAEEAPAANLPPELETPGEAHLAAGLANHSIDRANLAIGQANLAIGQTVSAALVEIVRGLVVRPRYLLAKGGITSSDIATRGLGIQRALVLGQILPGVPVWQSGAESRFPGLAYIVFPGNVGGPDALVKIVEGLRR